MHTTYVHTHTGPDPPPPRKPDVDEGMQWILFHYSGAAAAAGQSYSGAILASATGDWPAGKEGYIDRIHAALDRAGIKPWELFMVRCVLRAACYDLLSTLLAFRLTLFPRPAKQARPQLGRAPGDRPARRGPLPVPEFHGGRRAPADPGGGIHPQGAGAARARCWGLSPAVLACEGGRRGCTYVEVGRWVGVGVGFIAVGSGRLGICQLFVSLGLVVQCMLDRVIARVTPSKKRETSEENVGLLLLLLLH